jgi:hypothetical protein
LNKTFRVLQTLKVCGQQSLGLLGRDGERGGGDGGGQGGVAAALPQASQVAQGNAQSMFITCLCRSRMVMRVVIVLVA